MTMRLPRFIGSTLSKVIALMAITGNLFAAELQLIPAQSTLSYAAMKYGTMQVDGFLTESGKAGLSGHVLLEQAGADYHVSGEINLEFVGFDSHHARRDDQVFALFKTPIRLTLLSQKNAPCSPELGKCALITTLELNGRAERFKQDVSFFRDQSTVRAEGGFMLVRQAFDLVFKEGFASTLDAAVSSDIAIHFLFAFEGKDLIDIERLPEHPFTANVEEVRALEQGKDESLGQGRKPGMLNRVRAWLESF